MEEALGEVQAMTEALELLPSCSKTEEAPVTVSTPVMRVLCNAFPHPPPPHPPPPRSFFIFFALLQTPWIPRGTFFPRLMLHPDVRCLVDLQLGAPRGLHFGKVYRDVTYLRGFCRKGTAGVWGGVGEVADVPGAGLLYAFFPPSIWPFCPRKLSSQFLLPPIWSSFSSDRNITHHQGKQLHM